MKSLYVVVVVVFMLAVGLFLGAKPSLALTYGLVPPPGQLTVGQNADFTITIDTEGQSLTTATVGMTYQTGFMQFVQTSNGNTMDQVSAQETSPGTIIFTGTKTAGFKGAGDFTKVTFKVTAASQSNEVCALFIPQTTPAPQPTTAPVNLPTSAPAPTAAPGIPAPTALPKTGSPTNNALGGVIGLGFISILGGIYLFRKKLHSS